MTAFAGTEELRDADDDALVRRDELGWVDLLLDVEGAIAGRDEFVTVIANACDTRKAVSRAIRHISKIWLHERIVAR